MRILFAMHEIHDIGGIINHTEHLAWGMQKLGHEVSLLQMLHKEEVRNTTLKREEGQGESVFGGKVDQHYGWAFRRDQRFAYKGNERHWKTVTKDFDLVIWEVPMPFKTRKGIRSPWVSIVKNTSCPQVFIVHDGNFMNNNYELKEAKKYGDFVAVHECARDSMREGGLEASLIPNPQILPNPPVKFNWNKRGRNVLSVQTFKSCKRVNEFVESVPKMRADNIWLAGGGIMQRYYTSESKIKRGYEPRNWNKAVRSGMFYKGFISESYRDELMRQSRLLIDCTFSRNWVKSGAVFNRVLIDAIKMGAIPMGRKEIVESEYFTSGENYIGFEGPLTSETVNNALDLSTQEARLLCKNGFEILAQFEASLIAKKYLRFV